MRHGETGNIYNPLDCSISDKGHNQMRDNGIALSHMPIDKIVFSPLNRAIQSAFVFSVASKNSKVKYMVDYGLVEKRFGKLHDTFETVERIEKQATKRVVQDDELELLSTTKFEIKRTVKPVIDPSLIAKLEISSWHPDKEKAIVDEYGCEASAKVFRRVKEAYENLKVVNKNKTIVVVSHGGELTCMQAIIEGKSFENVCNEVRLKPDYMDTVIKHGEYRIMDIENKCKLELGTEHIK